MSLATEDFDYVRAVVRRQSAIVLEPGKEYLVEARLSELSRKEGGASIGDLVERMRRESTGRLTRRVVDAITTNETSFFRDIHPFHAVQRHVLPELMTARAPDRRLSFWCAAASSGQEPYSLSMALNDALQLHPGWQVSLLATDINQEMLDRTRAGVYSRIEINRGLPVAMLIRHFDAVGTQWQLKPAIRETVHTRRLNLAEPFPVMPLMDVVFLRNVLIYFSPQTKREVLRRVRQVLRPDGYLFLGGVETTLGLDDSFEQVILGNATAYRLRA